MLRFSPGVTERLRRGTAPVIVTGAGGWLGQAALEGLCGALGEDMRRVMVFGSTARPMVLRSGRVVAVQAYDTLGELAAAPGLILHFAFRTRGFAQEPGYIETNRRITATMRRFIERNGALGLFVPSTGVVYGPGRVPRQDFTGEPYGALKYEDELVFGALARSLGFPAAIIRIFNLAGPCMNNLTGYALACIITDVLRGGPITLRAAHPVWRAYAHVGDVLDIALSLLLQGHSPPVFDTAGAPLELGMLAALAARVITGAEMPIARPAWAHHEPDRYLGDMAAYAHAAALAGVTLRPLERQILDTAEDIRTQG